MSRTWTPGLFQTRGVRWPRRSGIKIYLNIPYLKCSNVKPSNQTLPKKVSKFLNLWPFKTGLRPHIKQMDLSWLSSFLANWRHKKPFFCQKLVQEYWLLCVSGSEPICSITAEDSQQERRGWIPGIFFSRLPSCGVVSAGHVSREVSIPVRGCLLPQPHCCPMSHVRVLMTVPSSCPFNGITAPVVLKPRVLDYFLWFNFFFFWDWDWKNHLNANKSQHYSINSPLSLHQFNDSGIILLTGVY